MLDPNTSQSILTYLMMQGNAPFLRGIQQGNVNRKLIADLISKYSNVTSTSISADDIDEVIDIANSLSLGKASTAMPTIAPNAATTGKVNPATTQAIRSILMMDPKARLIMGIGQGVSGLTRMFGNMAANNSNRLAAALLASQRTGTDKRDAIYGKSEHDKSLEAMAQNKIRSGNNKKIVTDTIADTIDKILGSYTADDQNARSMNAAQQLGGMSGAMAQAMHDTYMRQARYGGFYGKGGTK